jgi:hypothetical protein
MGPPITTPSTGAPALTKLVNPRARTRSSASNMRLIIAIADGPVAEPNAADSVRKRIIVSGFHAIAVRSANTPAPSRPIRKIFFWPYTSPALPAAGPTTPNTSIGPVIAHEMIDGVVPRSLAMSTCDTARIVTVTATVKRPARATASTNQRSGRPSFPPSFSTVFRRSR